MEKFEVFEDVGGDWRWRLVAANGELTAAAGESFRDATDAERSARGAAFGVARAAGFDGERAAQIASDALVERLTPDVAGTGHSAGEWMGTARDPQPAVPSGGPVDVAPVAEGQQFGSSEPAIAGGQAPGNYTVPPVAAPVPFEDRLAQVVNALDPGRENAELREFETRLVRQHEEMAAPDA